MKVRAVGYLEDIRRVAAAHREELEGDLDQARHALQKHDQEGADLQRRVESLEWLLEIAVDEDDRPEPIRLTLHDAMARVIQEAPQQMLRAGDIAREINRQRLYRMRDGRPVEAQQIHARVGQYPHLFVREGTFIKLADS